MHARFSHHLLFLLFCLTGVSLLTGCSSTNLSETNSPANAAAATLPVEESVEESLEESASSNPDLYSFDNTTQNWGQGVQFNDLNQPISAVEFQEKYASLQTNFIGPEEKVIWLTFDEGYENGYTESILNTLRENNCPAVFFLTGQYARENEVLIKQMIADGHVLGNHSWSHPSGGMPSLSIEEQVEDITKLHQYVKEQYQYDMTLFRCPAGIFSEQSLAVTQSLGYRSLFWSFAYVDWDPEQQMEPSAALNKLIERLHPGSIYLLHAVSATNAEILGDFIRQARENGYEFRLPE